MSERYTTARMPSARALGARSVMEGTYTGAELANTSARAGAYDAMRLPSLISGRQVSREQQREALRAPVPAAPTMPMSRSASSMADPDAAPLEEPRLDTEAPQTGEAASHVAAPAAYRPREGSGPHRVLEHLRTHGGHLLYTDVCAQFGIPSHSLTAIFKPALARGALIQLRVGDRRRRALALPGYELPPGVRTATAMPHAGIEQPHRGDPDAPSARPPLPLGTAEAFTSAAAELRRALENTARLLQQFAAALPSLNH